MIDFGYYFVGKDVRYPDHFKNNLFCSLWRTNIYSLENFTPPAPEIAVLQKIDIDRAARFEKGLVLALETGFARAIPAQKTIAQAKSHWHLVKWIEVVDEPDWSKAAATKEISRIAGLVKAAGLPPRPIGATLKREHTLGNNEILRAPWTYYGIEGYLDPAHEPTSPASAAAAVRSVLERQLRNLPAGVPAVFVAQSYTFGGAWSNASIPALVEMQRETFKVADETRRGGRPVLGILAFAYSRPSGALEHPELKVVHKQLVTQY